MLRYAYEHNAITAVPTDAIDRTTAKYAVGDGNAFEHKPVTGPQVAALMEPISVSLTGSWCLIGRLITEPPAGEHYCGLE